MRLFLYRSYNRSNFVNTELHDLRKFGYFRTSEVSVERISVYNVIEKLEEHGIHCLQCSFEVMSLGCHSVNVQVGYSLIAMVTVLCRHLTYDSRAEWHTVYAMLLSNYKGDST